MHLYLLPYVIRLNKDFHGKCCIQQEEEEDSFYQQTELKLKQETSEALHLEHSSVWVLRLGHFGK
jgi:hypothetical protein